MQQKRTMAEKLYQILAVLFGLFLLIFLLTDQELLTIWKTGAAENHRLYLLLGLWLVLMTGCGLAFGWLQKHCSLPVFSLLLFVVCALPRLAVLQFHYYIPTNDFANYLLYGQCFVDKNFIPAAHLIADYYQMPKMGGIVVFNGLMMLLFGDSLLGLQLANVVMTSCICVLLYHLLVSIHHRVALLAALLWMLYPSNVVSTQIPTNHHGAVLFILLALLSYQRLLVCKSWGRLIGLAASTGVCLALSNLIHPSVIVVQLSILCFTLLTILYYSEKDRHLFCSRNQKLLVAFLILLLTCGGIQQICMERMETAGIITDDQEISVLFKLVLGFNPERGGSYVEEDYTYIRSLPEDEQAEACLKLLRQRIESPVQAIQLMLQKTRTAWLGRDGYFYWYQEGALLEYSATEPYLTEEERQRYWEGVSWIDGAAMLDMLVLRLVYVLVAVGLFTVGKSFRAEIHNVMFFIPLGWIAVIMLTEMQSRYRYPAMPAFFMLAALGMYTIGQWCRTKWKCSGLARSQKTEKAGEAIGKGR